MKVFPELRFLLFEEVSLVLCVSVSQAMQCEQDGAEKLCKHTDDIKFVDDKKVCWNRNKHKHRAREKKAKKKTKWQEKTI